MRLQNKTILTGIIVLAVALRAAAAVYLGNVVENLPGTFDQISYHNLALRVIGGHGFSFGEPWWPLTAANAPTAHWSYLYTLYLTLVYAIFGPNPLAARLIQAVAVGILHPLLVYWIGRRLLGETVGLVSAAITAVYVYFVYYAATLMTEPFYITAILGVFLLTMLLIDRLANWKPGAPIASILLLAEAFGLALGATVLLRQVFLTLLPFLFLWILWVTRKNLRAALAGLAVSGLIAALMVLPFTLYNYIRFNNFVLLNTNAGYAFFYANHPIYGTKFIPILPPGMGSYQDLIPIELRHLDEAALDKALLGRGMQFVFDDPLRYLLLSASRIPAFFMFWPSPDSGMISNISRVGSFGIFWPFMLYGAALVIGSRKYHFGLSSPLFLVMAFCAVYTAVHLLSWALIRYRLPVDAVMLLFAGLALVDLYQRARAWLKRPAARIDAAGQSGAGQPN